MMWTLLCRFTRSFGSGVCVFFEHSSKQERDSSDSNRQQQKTAVTAHALLVLCHKFKFVQWGLRYHIIATCQVEYEYE